MSLLLNAVAMPLNLTTFAVVILIAVGLLLFFLRKKKNRHPMDTPEGKAAMERHRQDALKERREEGREPLDHQD